MSWHSNFDGAKMNFKLKSELTINVNDWYLFPIWTSEPFGDEVYELMEWLEENLDGQTYALWYAGGLYRSMDNHYLSIKHEVDVVAYKLRWL